MRTHLLALAAALALGGCKISDTIYQPPGDGDGGTDGDPGIDAPPEGIHVQVSPGTTSVSEGGQVTVQARLSEAPAADVMVDIIGTAVLMPTPAQLTFTPDNWSVNRTVILAAGQDEDASDSPVVVLFNGNGQVADGATMVMITDDDTLGLIVSPPSSLGVTEGAGGMVQVQLSADPLEQVVVAIGVADTGVATASTPQLTFNTGNWDVPQSFTITGAQDADFADDSTMLTLDPAPDGMATETLAINVTDEDILAIDVTPTNLGTLTEASGPAHTGTIAVELTQMPGGNVAVDVAVNHPGSASLSTTTLMFDPSNWDTPQNVTVTALQEDNVADEQLTLTFSGDGLSDRVVNATIDDDDTQVIEVVPGTIADLDEGTGTALQVRLRYEPASAVVVDIDSADSLRLSVATSQLTFTPGNYDEPQPVDINALDDIDLANQTITVSFNASAQGLTTNVGVTIDDDDTQGLDVAPTTLFLAEGGSGDVEIRLLYQPAGNVTVTIGSASPDIELMPGTLMFGPGDYDVPKPVSITAQQDPDTTSEMATVTVASTGLPSRQVTVNISDDDALDILVTPAGTLPVTEGDPTGRVLMVSLGAMPAANVMVNLTTLPTGVATLSVSQLTFTPGNYSTPQPVRVTGTQDADGADESTVITLAASGLDDKTVPVDVTDDEVITPVLMPNPLTLDEGKPSTGVTVRLNVDPGRTVFVEVPTFGFTDFEVSPAVYSFDPSNWFVGQDVTVLAYEDDTADPEVETALFQIPGEGSATLTVNTVDPTILVGFLPPHGTNPGIAPSQLEAYSDGTMPMCWTLEKVAVDVATVAGGNGGTIAVGLYTDLGGQPYSPVYENNQLSVNAAGLRVFDVPDQNIFTFTNSTSWIAVEVTSGVVLKSKNQTATTRCRRNHIFGTAMPNPFGGGTVGTPDAGSSIDSATGDGGTVTCQSGQPAPAIWFIGRPSGGVCGVDT
jgi:hypothetical protein